MQQGWICLHRGLLDWEWYNDMNTTRLFIHCLLRANHKENKWRGMSIERGQFWTSLPTLEKETGLSTSQIRTCINKLKSTGELTVKPQATGRMITVLKYNDYQDNDRPIDRPVTGQSQTSDRPVTANNNDNNKNNDNPENKKMVNQEMDSAFDLFWSAGMKKSNKAKSQAAFKRLAGSKPMEFAEKLALDIKARLSNQQMGFDKMMPTTYLNNSRWEDELTQERPSTWGSPKADFSFSQQNAQPERIINQPMFLENTGLEDFNS